MTTAHDTNIDYKALKDFIDENDLDEVTLTRALEELDYIAAKLKGKLALHGDVDRSDIDNPKIITRCETLEEFKERTCNK